MGDFPRSPSLNRNRITQDAATHFLCDRVMGVAPENATMMLLHLDAMARRLSVSPRDSPTSEGHHRRNLVAKPTAGPCKTDLAAVCLITLRSERS